jgi:predicted nucleic acid-binding protein
VLAYPKLAKVIPEGERLVDLVEMSSLVVEPTSVFGAAKDDSDNRVLEAAVDGAVRRRAPVDPRQVPGDPDSDPK